MRNAHKCICDVMPQMPSKYFPLEAYLNIINPLEDYTNKSINKRIRAFSKALDIEWHTVRALVQHTGSRKCCCGSGGVGAEVAGDEASRGPASESSSTRCLSTRATRSSSCRRWSRRASSWRARVTSIAARAPAAADAELEGGSSESSVGSSDSDGGSSSARRTLKFTSLIIAPCPRRSTLHSAHA